MKLGIEQLRDLALTAWYLTPASSTVPLRLIPDFNVCQMLFSLTIVCNRFTTNSETNLRTPPTLNLMIVGDSEIDCFDMNKMGFPF